MGNDTGKKALNQATMKWNQAQPAQSQGAGEITAPVDDQLAAGQHDRTYNPVDGATRGSVGAALNADSARYKKGPGPL